MEYSKNYSPKGIPEIVRKILSLGVSSFRFPPGPGNPPGKVNAVMKTDVRRNFLDKITAKIQRTTMQEQFENLMT